jgi:hypothetical protein
MRKNHKSRAGNRAAFGCDAIAAQEILNSGNEKCICRMCAAQALEAEKAQRPGARAAAGANLRGI